MDFYEAFADELEKIADAATWMPILIGAGTGGALGAGLGYGGAGLMGMGKKEKRLAALSGAILGGLGGATLGGFGTAIHKATGAGIPYIKRGIEQVKPYAKMVGKSGKKAIEWAKQPRAIGTAIGKGLRYSMRYPMEIGEEAGKAFLGAVK